MTLFRLFTRGLASGLLLVGSSILLTGCEEGIGATAPGATPTAGTGAISVTQDVERPDIFSVSEEAIWDGRPSLGGVWVAYPANTDPERVIIRNVDNGTSVIGALFRRERENPGPAIQLSSDAAAALGVVAGTPAVISVTVLRREEVEIESPEPEVEVAETEAVVEAAAELPPVTEIVEVSEAPVAAPAVGPAPNIGAMVENVLATTPVVANTVAATAVQAAAAAQQGNLPAEPYIQIGTFSTQERANALVTILENEGVQAEVRTNTSGNRTLYRVVSGPAQSVAERDARLQIIKGLGFSDAFIFG